MSAAWTVVLVVGLATMGIKAAGPVLLGGRSLPPALLGPVRLLGAALLAALVVTEVLAGDRRLVFDERLLGLAAAALALALRAPILVVIVAAAATTAMARLWL